MQTIRRKFRSRNQRSTANRRQATWMCIAPNSMTLFNFGLDNFMKLKRNEIGLLASKEMFRSTNRWCRWTILKIKKNIAKAKAEREKATMKIVSTEFMVKRRVTTRWMSTGTRSTGNRRSPLLLGIVHRSERQIEQLVSSCFSWENCATVVKTIWFCSIWNCWINVLARRFPLLKATGSLNKGKLIRWQENKLVDEQKSRENEFGPEFRSIDLGFPSSHKKIVRSEFYKEKRTNSIGSIPFENITFVRSSCESTRRSLKLRRTRLSIFSMLNSTFGKFRTFSDGENSNFYRTNFPR